MDELIEKYKPFEELELKNINEELPKVFKKIYCPSCHEEVTSDNINLQNSLSKCSNCNVIFSIEKEVENIKSKNEIKQEVLRPEGIDLFYYKDELDITIQQHIEGFNAWAIGFSPLFALISIGIYFVEKITISPFIPIAFSLLAIYYIYKAFNYSNHKTYIDINNRSLSIKRRPNNFKKDKFFSVDEIDQIYIKPSLEGAGYQSIYMITNGLEGQKHEKLMTVNSLSKAKYLEQEIETYLNIKNREVAEEKI